jgi:hypothetical protein
MTSLISSSCFPNLDPKILNSILPVPTPSVKKVSPTVNTKIVEHSVNTNAPNYSEIYPFVKSQNETLKNTIKSKKEMYSTDNQQSIYKYDKYNALVSANYFLFIVYASVGCFLFIFLLMTENLSILPKFLIIVSFIIYPFVIFYLENKIYMIGIYLYSVLSGESYWDMSSQSREIGFM